jgi:hypothetical protein
MGYKIPKAVKAKHYGDDHPRRNSGDGGAGKKLKSASNKLRFKAGHIKQSMKKY